MQTGLVRRATLGAFWPLFFVRLVTDVDLSPLQLVLLGTVMELSILTAEVAIGIVLGAVAEILTVPTAMTVSALLFALAGVMALTARATWDTSIEDVR